VARPLPWIKLWVEAIHDPKILDLTLAERGAWWSLLALAGECGGDGALRYQDRPLTLAQMGRSLHLSQEGQAVLEGMVAKMEAQGSLAWNVNTLYVVNWVKRQRRKPSDRPEAVAERVRRWRECKGDAPVTPGNALQGRYVTRYGGVPPLTTPPETEEDKEKEKDGNALRGITTGYEREAEAQRCWQGVVARVAKDRAMRFWLERSRPLGFTRDGFLVVEVPDEQRRQNLAFRYQSAILRVLRGLPGQEAAEIAFVLPQGVPTGQEAS